MRIKGRYVAQIELDFNVDLSGEGKATPQKFKENISDLNEYIDDLLKSALIDNSDGVETNLTLTQQYFDMHEIGGEE